MKIGNKVQLLSGGPAMTIAGLINSDACTCFWFNTLNELQVGTFSIVVLKIVA